MLVRPTALAAIASLFAAACLAPMDPASVPIGSVRVTLGDRSLPVDTLAVRRTARVNAVAIARDGGYQVPITAFRYGTSNAATAIVDSLGVVHAVSPGTAIISATAPDGTHGNATVVVVPSTVDYDIAVGGAPGAIAFSPDYTKAYVAVKGGDVAVVDAIGFYRLSTVSLGAEIGDLAATGSLLYATHPASGSVSVIATATHELRTEIPLGGSPSGVVARGTKAWVATGTAQRIVVLDGESVTASFATQGAPADLALSVDGAVLYVALATADTWSLAIVDCSSGAERGRVALPGRPVSLAVSQDEGGVQHVYAVIPDVGRLVEISVAGAQPSITRSIAIPAGIGGVAARGGDSPLIILSGSPLGIYDGRTLGVIDTVDGGGTGTAALRPDGLFVFVGDPAANAVRVIGL